jgi:hypothetical protein
MDRWDIRRLRFSFFHQRCQRAGQSDLSPPPFRADRTTRRRSGSGGARFSSVGNVQGALTPSGSASPSVLGVICGRSAQCQALGRKNLCPRRRTTAASGFSHTVNDSETSNPQIDEVRAVAWSRRRASLLRPSSDPPRRRCRCQRRSAGGLVREDLRPAKTLGKPLFRAGFCTVAVDGVVDSACPAMQIERTAPESGRRRFRLLRAIGAGTARH